MFQFPGFAFLTLYIQAKNTYFNQRSLDDPHRKNPVPIPKDRCTCVEQARSVHNNKSSNNRRLLGGFPHSEIHGSKHILGSPWLIAEYHVLHRLLLPRHPPNALFALDSIQKRIDTGSSRIAGKARKA